MSEARSFLFPYCIIQLADGRYIVVNRYYKPLGGHTHLVADALISMVRFTLSWRCSTSFEISRLVMVRLWVVIRCIAFSVSSQCGGITHQVFQELRRRCSRWRP